LHHAPSQCRIQARTQHSHRRALLRNLVRPSSSKIAFRPRAKAKAVRPLIEKMITLGKKAIFTRAVRRSAFS